MLKVSVYALLGALLLAGCAHKAPVPAQPVDSAGEAPMGPASGSPDSEAGEAYSPATAGNTGTAVGQKVQTLRGDLATLDNAVHSQAAALQALRASTQTNAADYFNTVANINAKLQVGTTTGNPLLVAQWNAAQTKLDNLNQDVGSLNDLSNQIAQSASHAAYLLEAVRATYGLSGAVDEDHANLGALEDDTNRTVVLIDRLLNEVSGDLNRQSSYVSSERRNLQTLALAISNGELYGPSFANRPFMNLNSPPSNLYDENGVSPRSTGHGSSAVRAEIETGKPLVVIRFDRENVNYEHAVYQAVSKALDRYPNASFDVVAVSPAGNNPAEAALLIGDAKRNADGVARALSQLGLPPGRVHMSATKSGSASTTEVQIFVRA
jgi:hypothetical protein